MWKILKKEPKVEALVEKEQQEKPYDHGNKSMIKACGLTDEQIEDIKSLTVQFIKESESFSELCKKMEDAFSKRELAFLATQHVARVMKNAVVTSKMEEIFNDIEHMM